MKSIANALRVRHLAYIPWSLYIFSFLPLLINRPSLSSPTSTQTTGYKPKRRYKVTFTSATARGLPWTFVPLQKEIEVCLFINPSSWSTWSSWSSSSASLASSCFESHQTFPQKQVYPGDTALAFFMAKARKIYPNQTTICDPPSNWPTFVTKFRLCRIWPISRLRPWQHTMSFPPKVCTPHPPPTTPT